MTPTPAQRERFDRLFEAVLAELPERIAQVLEEVPVHLDDAPDRAVLREFGLHERDVHDAADQWCGLHTGVMLTERSIDDHPTLPDHINLYRQGIARAAGGWHADDETIRREIQITLLHEIGHHFGLDEDDLDRLGYA